MQAKVAGWVLGIVLVGLTAGCERKVKLRVKVEVADSGTATSTVTSR